MLLFSWLALLSVGVSTAAQVGPRSPTTTPYRINAGDELEVLVWGDERLQRDVLVLPDGSLLISDDAAGAIYRVRYRGG